MKTIVQINVATSGNVKMEIGSGAETVQVDAGAVQVQQTQSNVQDIITQQQIQSLPVNGRNFLDLAQLEPGVQLQDGNNFDPTKAGYSGLSLAAPLAAPPASSWMARTSPTKMSAPLS